MAANGITTQNLRNWVDRAEGFRPANSYDEDALDTRLANAIYSRLDNLHCEDTVAYDRMDRANLLREWAEIESAAFDLDAWSLLAEIRKGIR